MRGGIRRRVRGVATCGALLGLAAVLGGCGATTTVTVTVTAAGSTAAPSPSASPTGGASTTTAGTTTAAPVISLVWAVTNAAGAVAIRTATPGGGRTRAVATLPAGAIVMAMGHGRVVAQAADHHIITVDLATGRQTRHPGGAGPLFGGAFDETGQRFAFVDAVSPTSIHLDVLDLVSDRITTVSPLALQFVSPTVWVGSVLAGPVVAGFSDAPDIGARRVSATTGVTLASATVPAAATYIVFDDGVHGAVTLHAALGDDGDVPSAPGPQGPFNTLRTFAIGKGGSALASSTAHHQLAVLDGTPDGGTLLVSDTSAAGGFAGISMSPDFGLFLVRGTNRTQLAHIGADRLAGVILQGGSSVVVAESSGNSMALMEYGTSEAPVRLDTAPGTQAVVGLVSSD